MVQAGSLKIRGGLDTSIIERGFQRVKQGFMEVAKFGKGVTSDLSRMAVESGRVARALATVGAVGAGTFINLAKGAPAVAGAMAQIGIETDRLQRALGVALQPAFDKFSTSYTKFVNFVEANPDITSAFTIGAVGVAGLAGMAKLLGITVSASLLVALGHLAVIGAVAFGGFKGLEFLTGKADTALGFDQGDITPQITPGGYVSRVGEAIRGKITGKRPLYLDIWDFDKGEVLNNPNRAFVPGGMISLTQEKDRKFILLELWDNVWS